MSLQWCWGQTAFICLIRGCRIWQNGHVINAALFQFLAGPHGHGGISKVQGILRSNSFKSHFSRRFDKRSKQLARRNNLSLTIKWIKWWIFTSAGRNFTKYGCKILKFNNSGLEWFKPINSIMDTIENKCALTK